MKLTSTVPVTYNDSVATTKTVVMNATIEERVKYRTEDFTRIVYKYEDADGDLYATDREDISNTEMDALYETVKADLPDIDVVGHAYHEEYKYLLGVKVKMLERFTVLAANEIVVDDEAE